MSVVERLHRLSPQEYLDGELLAEVRHEYVDGQIYAMVGGSRAHNIIALNMAVALRGHLRGGPCQIFVADMKVRVADAFYYPDVVVNCDVDDRHEYYVARPVLVAEVLSPATEARDLLEKRVVYQGLASLREYVVIAQDKTEVRVYRRRGDGWELETCRGADSVCLQSVDLTMSVESVYEGVAH
ncbi:MAG: Uma2 family endonuclease [Nitrococcus sp.]|nr:Uma2 family endonuclease [Nitrococcus sp.]